MVEGKILCKIPVRLCRDFSESMYVFQFPNQPFGFRKAPFAARMKPDSEMVELDIPTFDPGSENYDLEKGREMAQIIASGAATATASTSTASSSKEKNGNNNNVGSSNFSSIDVERKFLDRITLRSSRVPHNANMMIGVFKDGELVLIPYDRTIQLRPSFSHIDAMESVKSRDRSRQNLESTGDDEQADDDMTMGDDVSKATTISVQFKRKESEAIAAARLRSVNHLQKLVDAEKFISLQLFGECSEESQQRSDIIVTCASSLNNGHEKSDSSPMDIDKNVQKSQFIDSNHYISHISPISCGNGGEVGNGNVSELVSSGLLNVANGRNVADSVTKDGWFSIEKLKGMALSDQIQAIFLHLKLCPIYRLKDLLSRAALTPLNLNISQLLEYVSQNAVLVSSEHHWIVKSKILFPSPTASTAGNSSDAGNGNKSKHLLSSATMAKKQLESDKFCHTRNLILYMLHKNPFVTRKDVMDATGGIVSFRDISLMLEPIAILKRGQGWCLKPVASNSYLDTESEISSLLEQQEFVLDTMYQEAQAFFSSQGSVQGQVTGKKSNTVAVPVNCSSNSNLSSLESNILSLLKDHSICDLNFLAGTLKQAPTVIESVLSSLKTKAKITMLPGSCWAANEIGDTGIDPYRIKVLTQFQHKQSLKKSDIMEAIGESVSSALYTKIMKTLAVSKGSSWTLKPSPLP